MPELKVLEIQGDASTTDALLELPKSDIPGFSTSDNAPIQAVHVPIFDGLSKLYIGAGVGELALTDLELVGDTDTESGDLQIEKSLLGTLIQEGQPLPTLPYEIITHRGHPILEVTISEPEASPVP